MSGTNRRTLKSLGQALNYGLEPSRSWTNSLGPRTAQNLGTIEGAAQIARFEVLAVQPGGALEIGL
jgi:hypothetical protein